MRAFARVHEGRAAMTVVTRLPGHLPGIGPVPLADPSIWNGTYIVTPRNFLGRRTNDVMARQTGQGTEMTGRLPLSEVLATLPVALLEVR